MDSTRGKGWQGEAIVIKAGVLEASIVSRLITVSRVEAGLLFWLPGVS